MKKTLLYSLMFLLCGPVFGANDFSAAVNLEGLWTFESYTGGSDDPLDTSGNGNLITEIAASGSPFLEESLVKEGAKSAGSNAANFAYFLRIDGDLSADFPVKDGTSNNVFSTHFWAYPTSFSASEGYIIGKYQAGANKRSFQVLRQTDGGDNFWRMNLGYNSGVNYEVFSNSRALTINQWYFVGVSYNGPTKAWHIRVWDQTASTVYDSSGTGAETISIGTADFTVLNRADGTGGHIGIMDEVGVWSRILSSDEFDAIRNGTFGASAGQLQIFFISKDYRHNDYWHNFLQDGINGKWRMAA